MNFYTEADEWDEEDPEIPHTSKHARPTAWISVSGGTVVKMKNGTYRGAVFSDTFLLDERIPITTNKQGWHEGTFYCRWFDKRLKTRGIKIVYNPATSEVIEKFVGDVVKNLSL